MAVQKSGSKEESKQTALVKPNTYKNTMPNVLDLRGLVFKGGEEKSLTAEQLKNKRVQYAIKQGILVEAK